MAWVEPLQWRDEERPKPAAATFDDQLGELWAAGATLSQIEQATGVSRGVAIGRIHRARKGGDPRFQPSPPKPATRKLRPVGEEVGNRRRVPLPIPPKPRLLIDLGPRDCKWPLSERDGRHLFCGQPQALGRPYCERHCGAVVTASAV